ncbi:phasin family protein [Marinibactrum halimedae]|uniref:Phasin domain-containing protein n=1 Tax=Marinibactrum halimedae TaxID=1444977 RepID=A0AA37TD67_9GAMM|nr:phasin family protein [Marinibactrum halimedae]MCD9459398.1 phasin family protein [Marinibactrum halimedae]GLS27535.1 hypothetical protein GCM10007877_32540 [Marinibactrum halimedae]
MFDKIVEQAQSAYKPLSEMMTINAEAMEKLTEKNTTLFTGMMNDGITYAKDLAAQKDLAGIYETQKSYAENIQEKVMSAAKDSYSLMTDTSEKVGEILNGAFSEIKKFEAAAMPQTSAPAKSAKTTATKAKTTKAATAKAAEPAKAD